MKKYPGFHIGTLGEAWGSKEMSQWLSEQTKQRDYFTDVLSPLMRLNLPGAHVFQYGELDYRQYGSAKFPLFAVRSDPWVKEYPMVLVTGGVHGYETSGVHGALQFVQKHFLDYSIQDDDDEKKKKAAVNILVIPCVSPWGYEMIHRWNPLAIDPNRQFIHGQPGCLEAAAVMACTDEYAASSKSVLLHADLHETTDTDNSVFRPSLFARDGTEPEEWSVIPDGFYNVGDAHREEVEFHRHVIKNVKTITHIAAPDENGNIIGLKLIDEGLITYPGPGLCGVHTAGKYVVTTEVYPDSAKATPEQCNLAQMMVVTSGIEYAVAHQ